MTSDTVPAVLIAMPHSHYSEKARWALDWLFLPYREEPHAPLLHRLATTCNGGRSVPVLVHGTARFTDSTEFLVHADSARGGNFLYPRDAGLRQEVEALEARFEWSARPRHAQDHAGERGSVH